MIDLPQRRPISKNDAAVGLAIHDRLDDRAHLVDVPGIAGHDRHQRLLLALGDRRG